MASDTVACIRRAESSEGFGSLLSCFKAFRQLPWGEGVNRKSDGREWGSCHQGLTSEPPQQVVGTRSHRFSCKSPEQTLSCRIQFFMNFPLMQCFSIIFLLSPLQLDNMVTGA